jgi:hypothetical protein
VLSRNIFVFSQDFFVLSGQIFDLSRYIFVFSRHIFQLYRHFSGGKTPADSGNASAEEKNVPADPGLMPAEHGLLPALGKIALVNGRFCRAKAALRLAEPPEIVVVGGIRNLWDETPWHSPGGVSARRNYLSFQYFRGPTRHSRAPPDSHSSAPGHRKSLCQPAAAWISLTQCHAEIRLRRTHDAPPA